jgi:hypothetical protein
MTLRKFAPALLLLAACSASTVSTTETQSVGMKPESGKACCVKQTECSDELKAACEKANVKCSAETKPEAAPATTNG